MESTSSVSQGSFLLLPDEFSLSKWKKAKKRKSGPEKENRWEKAFDKIWRNIERELKDVNEELFGKVLKDIIDHMKKLYGSVKVEEGIVPCELLVTGTNLPDHKSLLSALVNKIKQDVTPLVAVLSAKDCSYVKNAVYHVASQIIPHQDLGENLGSEQEGSSDDELVEEVTASKVKLQASQLTMSTLSSWYSSQFKKEGKNPSMIIILPDFESFLPTVLNEFLILLSTYTRKVPLILIFGVATTPVAVYQTLNRDVLSQLVIQVFRSEPSPAFLNHVIENIFFSEKCPFHLGTKCITYLSDIFLFQSFSVQAFIQGFKFCLMEHFYKQNHFSLCCNIEDVDQEVNLLTVADIENIRKLPSFQKHVESSSKDERKLLLLDNSYLKKVIGEMIRDAQEYENNFVVILKCLHYLTHDLPQFPLGRHLREYYSKAISNKIKDLPEYKECIDLLHLQSRSELSLKINLILELLKLNSILDILSLDKNTKFDAIIAKMEEFKRELDEMIIPKVPENEEDVGTKNFETLRRCILDYIEKEMVEKLLEPLTSFPLHEIIYFDNISAVRRRISASPRNSIHLSLTNPSYYLQCNCCELANPETILASLPDLSIAYKLHLECNKIINLYDWLQAFATVVKENDSDETEIDQQIQARFTRAVSELQFLGFVKPSRAKTDHVSRLTWGTC